MKVLLENWRRFLKEEQGATESKVGLYHERSKDVEELVLYRLSQETLKDGQTVTGPEVISYMELEETWQRCIPQTWQVSRTYTDLKHQKQGWGTQMYGMAFFAINRLGRGLTSDQNSSTSSQAGDRWKKFIQSGELTPRKTPGIPPDGGHDKFDYGGKKHSPKIRLMTAV